MQNRERIAQALAALGSLVLFVAATFHGISGYRAVFGALHGVNAPQRIVPALKALWLIASWHWIAVGILALIAALTRTWLHRAILLLCALVAFVDSGLAVAACPSRRLG